MLMKDPSRAVLQTIIFLIFFSTISAKTIPKNEDKDQIQRVPIQPDKMIDLYQHWMEQAFSGLFAAVASKKLKLASKSLKEEIAQCSKKAKTVILHAKCVIKMMEDMKNVQIIKVRHIKKNLVKVLKPKKGYRTDQVKEKYYGNQAFVQEPTKPSQVPSRILQHNRMLKYTRKSQKSNEIIIFQKSSLPDYQRTTIIPEYGSYEKRYSRNRFRTPNTRLLKFEPRSHELYRTFNRRKSLQRFKPIPNRRYENYRLRKPLYSIRKPKLYTKSKLLLRIYKSNDLKHKNYWFGSYRRRMKREVLRRDSYELKNRFDDMSPIGFVAKILTKALLATKNKTEVQPWQYAIDKIRKKSLQEKEIQRELKEARKSFEEYRFRGLRHENIDADELVSDPRKAEEFLNDQEITDPKIARQQKLMRFLREGIKLGYSIAGHNTSKFDEKNFKAFSPRLLSVVPDDDDNKVDLFSPSLFSLHNKGKGLEKMASLPNLIKGFNQNDQQELMNLIMEAAGVNEQVDELEKNPKMLSNQRQRMQNFNKKKLEQVSSNNKTSMTPYLTKENATRLLGPRQERKIEIWEKLVKSYTKDQLHEINVTGYTTLTKEQLYLVYGPNSPFNCSDALKRLTSLNSSHVHDLIDEDVKSIAQMRSFKLRQKDIILSPIVFSPVVFAWPILNQLGALSPLVFSPIIGTPSVLGPLVLSPVIFSPLVLSPRVLAPVILDPLLFDPIILSPMVLTPFILTPGVFVPIILNPFVLSPFILSPQVFSPIILSPIVLNPLILNPMVGSPLVLSPFVLTPIILSPQALFALVLSPYALSPNVESKLYLSTVFLSPSIFS